MERKRSRSVQPGPVQRTVGQTDRCRRGGCRRRGVAFSTSSGPRASGLPLGARAQPAPPHRSGAPTVRRAPALCLNAVITFASYCAPGSQSNPPTSRPQWRLLATRVRIPPSMAPKTRPSRLTGSDARPAQCFGPSCPRKRLRHLRSGTQKDPGAMPRKAQRCAPSARLRGIRIKKWDPAPEKAWSCTTGELPYSRRVREALSVLDLAWTSTLSSRESHHRQS